MQNKINVLVLGSGGREHALAWKISQSPLLGQLYTAPGNAGTSKIATNIAINLSDFEAVKQILLQLHINLLVVGPEDPLVQGLGDFCRQDPQLQDIVFVGPGAAGAQLEGSKDFAKAFMQRHSIPTASYQSFTAGQYPEACEFLDSLSSPYVLKADGLAAGKGVLIETDIQEAKDHLKEMFSGKFGKAGARVVIEEFLKGIELSVFVLTDGRSFIVLPNAKDYKRIGNSDTGLNTGGMGAVSPVCFASPAFMEKVRNRIIVPTIQGLKAENIPYQGFIFLGLMNCSGDPYVIEYNVRMGDPETEAVMPRIEGDLLEAFASFKNQSLDSCHLSENPKTCVCVVAVSGGYPQTYSKHKLISGLDCHSSSMVFHMGTALCPQGVESSGGRVLAVSAMGDNMLQAREMAYNSLSGISFEGMYNRSDIALDLMAIEE